MMTNLESKMSLLPFKELKQDPEVSKETIDSLIGFVDHFCEERSKHRRSIENLTYFDAIEKAYINHGWKNELSDLASACKICFDFLFDESNFPYTMVDFSNAAAFMLDMRIYLSNPNDLLFLTLEKSDFDKSTFQSLNNYFNNYSPEKSFGWVSGYVKSYLNSLTKRRSSPLNKTLNPRLINLFDFYGRDIVKETINSYLKSPFNNSLGKSNDFFNDYNHSLLNLKNEYPSKSFEVLSYLDDFAGVDFNLIPRFALIRSRGGWFFDEILNNAEILKDKWVYDDTLICYQKGFKKGYLTSKKHAQIFFKLVLESDSINDYIVDSDEIENYFKFYHVIEDPGFKEEFSVKDLKLLSESYDVCLNYLESNPSDLMVIINVNQFEQLFCSYFNEAISSGETVDEKRSNLREWSSTVTKMMRNKPELLFEYFSDKSYVVGGVR